MRISNNIFRLVKRDYKTKCSNSISKNIKFKGTKLAMFEILPWRSWKTRQKLNNSHKLLHIWQNLLCIQYKLLWNGRNIFILCHRTQKQGSKEYSIFIMIRTIYWKFWMIMLLWEFLCFQIIISLLQWMILFCWTVLWQYKTKLYKDKRICFWDRFFLTQEMFLIKLYVKWTY